MKIKLNTRLSWAAILLASLPISLVHAATPVSVIASSDDGNVAANTLDANLSTRWSAQGDGQWIQYDLGADYAINSLDIALYKGDSRSSSFDVQTSADANTWQTVFSGSQASSTVALQNIALDTSDGRYVRVVGHGNTANNWNSITEIEINTSAIDDGGSTDVDIGASASTDDGNVAANVLDGDFNTRWSANGSGAWLQLNLGSSQEIGSVDLAFFKGDQRSALFDLQVSANGSSWTTVLSGANSSGTQLSLESFSVAASQAQFVRYIGYGNSANSWNSITEMSVSADGGTNGGDTGGGGDDGGDGGGDTGGGGDGGTGSGTTHSATPSNFQSVLSAAAAGDTIVVTGTGSLAISDKSFSAPVTIRAASIGATKLNSATVKNSNNVIIQGFVFGPSDESTLLKIENSTNVSVLRNVFDHKGVTENQTSIVTSKASQNIAIGYNEFRDKNLGDRNGTKITGSFIKTQYDDPLMTKNLHVYRNHFKAIAPFLVNGIPAGDSDREAIAMGIADSQDVITNNVVEYNLFENCDGENEIITVKTSNNVFRYNTFKNSMGSLSFRLGSNNQAYNNYFYGVGGGDAVTDDNYQTGGIRVYGSGHSIHNNYMKDLTGISWRRPILVDSGNVSDSSSNDSHEVSTNIDVYDNTILNSVGGIYVGSSNYGKQPTGISITNNLVAASVGALFGNTANQSSNVWSANKAYASGSAVAVEGGALSSSQVTVLSGSPSVSAPSPLSATNVGPNAP